MNNTPTITPPHSLIVSGIHLELSDGIRASVERHSAKIFRHEPRTQRLRVDLEHDKTRSHDAQFVAKLHAEIPGNDILVSSPNTDLYAAIDLAFSKLDRQLVRRHEHRRSSRRDASLKKIAA